MPASPISSLPADQQQELLDELNYLNIAEIKSFCKRHSMPYTIAIETKDECRRKTNEEDRKGVILNRIRHFLRTGVVLEERAFGPQSCVLTHFRKSSHRTTGRSTD